MLHNIEDNSYLISIKNNISTIIHYFKNIFSDYIWKLEDIKLQQKHYIAYFRIKGNAEIVKISFNDIDDDVLYSINPLDAYICGIVKAFQTNNIYLDDLNFLLTYFEQNYHHQAGCEVLSFKGVDMMQENHLILSTIIINKTKVLSFEEIVKNPFIILGLPSNQAFQVGLTSFILWRNRHA